MRPLYPMPEAWRIAPPVGDRDTVQAWMLESIRAARAAGRSRLLLHASMGVGKTVTAAKLAREVQEHGERVVFLCHRVELVDQAARAFHDWGLEFKVEQGKRKAKRSFWDRKPFHLIALKDSLRPARLEAMLSRTGLRQHPIVAILDECHLAASNSFLKPTEGLGPVFTLGLSGTPMRLDGKPLVGDGAPFEAVVCRYDFLTACRHGILCPPVFRECEGSVDLRQVKITRQPQGADYDPETLRLAINEQLHHICNVARLEMEKRDLRRVLFFASDVGVARAVERWYTSIEGFPCRAVYGTLPDRHAVIRSYREGQLRVLVSVEMLDLGFDDPPTAGVILATPTRSAVKAMQQAGRGSRLHPGKERYWCIGYRWEDGREGPQSTLDLLLRAVPDEDIRAKARGLLLDPIRPRDLVEAVEEADLEVRKEREEERRRRESLRVVGVAGAVPYVGRTYDPMQESTPSALDPKVIRRLVECGKERTEAASISAEAASKFLDIWEPRKLAGMSSYKQVRRLMHGVDPRVRLQFRDAMSLTSKEAQSLIYRLRNEGLCYG